VSPCGHGHPERAGIAPSRRTLSEWCSEGAIGGANEGTIDVAPGSLHQALGPIAGVLRAGGRHAITQAAIGLKVEDERRKSLAEKGWARRAVVVRGVGPCGGADLEQLPGREEYGGATRMAHSTGSPPRCSSPRTTSTAFSLAMSVRATPASVCEQTIPPHGEESQDKTHYRLSLTRARACTRQGEHPTRDFR
jgi:hypothetical protein